MSPDPPSSQPSPSMSALSLSPELVLKIEPLHDPDLRLLDINHDRGPLLITSLSDQHATTPHSMVLDMLLEAQVLDNAMTSIPQSHGPEALLDRHPPPTTPQVPSASSTSVPSYLQHLWRDYKFPPPLSSLNDVYMQAQLEQEAWAMTREIVTRSWPLSVLQRRIRRPLLARRSAEHSPRDATTPGTSVGRSSSWPSARHRWTVQDSSEYVEPPNVFETLHVFKRHFTRLRTASVLDTNGPVIGKVVKTWSNPTAACSYVPGTPPRSRKRAREERGAAERPAKRVALERVLADPYMLTLLTPPSSNSVKIVESDELGMRQTKEGAAAMLDTPCSPASSGDLTPDLGQDNDQNASPRDGTHYPSNRRSGPRSLYERWEALQYEARFVDELDEWFGSPSKGGFSEPEIGQWEAEECCYGLRPGLEECEDGENDEQAETGPMDWLPELDDFDIELALQIDRLNELRKDADWIDKEESEVKWLYMEEGEFERWRWEEEREVDAFWEETGRRLREECRELEEDVREVYGDPTYLESRLGEELDRLGRLLGERKRFSGNW